MTARPATPRGFKVVRVDMKTRRVYDFAVNMIQGAASRLPHEGFERPSHCQFGPDGALYVVDWGEIKIAPEIGGIRMKKQTGTLWRIRRTDGPRGERPPEPMVVPLHALQNLAGLVGIVGAAVAAGLLIKRALSGGDDESRISGEARQRVLKEKKKLLLAWLNDAYAMEKALIPILENHARDAKDYPHIRARDLEHLEQTRHHADLVRGCIERLGESPSTTKTALGSLIGTMNSVATGPFEDELVKNFLSDYAAEHLEIASYKALIAAAQEVGDRETALVCEQILWEEEEMARWLEENLPMAVRETLHQTGR